MQIVSYWILGSEIPSWFHNRDFHVLDKIDRFRDNHVVQTSNREISSQRFQDIKNDVVHADSIVSIKVDVS